MEVISADKDDVKGSLKEKKEVELYRERLSKRLTYILRYGAKKEGLQMDESGKTILTYQCFCLLVFFHCLF